MAQLPSSGANRIAFVVPTKDRPDDLRRMLRSLAAQTRKPDQVVVVDGSDPPVRAVVDEFLSIGVEYERVFPPSLARQRNAGMARLARGITLAGYLDDDIVLEPDAVAAMMAFWDTAPASVGGAAFNIVNNPRPGALGLKRLFGIDSGRPGAVLRSGFAASIPCQSEAIETDWLYGGATIWRRAVIDAYGYDEWFVGTGFMEDIDYSFNVRGKYRLVLVPDARLAHYSYPVRPDRQYLLGMWQVINRMYFVRKYRARGLSVAHAWWATLGLVLLNAGAGLAKLDGARWNRACGNMAGALSVLKGRLTQLGGHLK